MYYLVRPIRILFKAMLGEATAGQLALGFALGVWIGLVPKGNLTAVAMSMLMAASRANLGVAAATILIVSFASPWLDPVFHGVGMYMLSHPSLNVMWTDLYNMPVVPWTAFNNSVVLGSFLVGLMVVYPCYRASKPLFRKYTEVVGAWARRFWLTRFLMGVEWADRLTVSN